MSAKLILNLIDLAIALARSHLDAGDAKQALLGIVRKGIRAYEDHTGEPLDPLLIQAEEPV